MKEALKTALLTRVMAAMFSGFMSSFNLSNALCLNRPERTSKILATSSTRSSFSMALNASLRQFL